jgi:hypothetical protein
MKYALGLLMLVALVNTGSAQSVKMSLSPSANARVSTSEFRAQVKKEIARYSHGEMMYCRCDVFARIINCRVAARLGLKSTKEGMMIEAADTSYVNDISRTPQDQDETSIVISRKDPRLIVAGANDDTMTYVSMPAYVTTNSGDTWQTYRLPNPDTGIYGMTASGDPVIATDDNGNFYYAFLINGFNLADTSSVSDVIVARSSDGRHWTLGSPVLGLTAPGIAFEDKEFIVVDRDPNSRHHGRLYIAWNEFTGDTAGDVRHLLTFSDNQGQAWSAPIEYTHVYGYFPLVRVGKNGTLFIASSTEDDTDVITNNSNSDGMTVSTDGGLTFKENPISNYALFPQNPNGYPGLKGDKGFRAFPYVAFDVEPTNNRVDAVYESYDQNYGAAELFTTQSTNAGQSWSDPKEIGTPSLIGNDHFMPWVSYDPVTGETNISLYSSEEDPTLNIESRAVHCSFEIPTQLQHLSSRLFDPLVDTIDGWDFIGDYSGNDSYAGIFAAAWTETRPPNHDDGDIFAYVSSPLSSVSGETHQINAQELDVSSVAPNPTSGDAISFTIVSNDQLPASIHVFDLRGNEVLTSQLMMEPSIENVVKLDIHSLKAGVYHAQINCGRQSVQKNFVILR